MEVCLKSSDASLPQNMLFVTCMVERQLSSFSPLALATLLHTRALSWLPGHGQSSPRDTCKYNLELRVRRKQFCTLLFFTCKRHQPHVLDNIQVRVKNSETKNLFPKFLPRHTISCHLPASCATSLTCEPGHVLLLANIAVKWEMTFSCFTEVWLDWTYLAY